MTRQNYSSFESIGAKYVVQKEAIEVKTDEKTEAEYEPYTITLNLERSGIGQNTQETFTAAPTHAIADGDQMADFLFDLGLEDHMAGFTRGACWSTVSEYPARDTVTKLTPDGVNLRNATKETIIATDCDFMKGWATPSWEEVIERDPDVVLILDYDYDTEAKTEFLKTNEFTSQLRAVKEGRIYSACCSDMQGSAGSAGTVEIMAKQFCWPSASAAWTWFETIGRILTNRLTGRAFFEQTWKDSTELTVWTIRLPRILTAFVVGAGLTLCGILMQVLTKNSLADPYVLGISHGASAGAVSVIMYGWLNFLSGYGTMVGAFLGAVLSILLALRIATIRNKVTSTQLVLAGIAVSALFGALTNFMIYHTKTGSDKVKTATYWMMGSLSGSSWEKLKLWIIIIATLLTGIIVSINGKVIVDGVSLGIETGDFVGFVGPNGCGKSTLLKCIYRTYQPERGSVYIDGNLTNPMSNRELAREMSVMQQENIVEFDMTVFDMAMLGRFAHQKMFGNDMLHERELVRAALKEVGMEGYEERSFLSLSGGEKQRTLVAGALVQQAPLILLDEPTNHLDIGFHTDLPLKVDKDLRGWFSPCKAEDAGGLSPAKDDNAAWRKADRKDCLILMGVQYQYQIMSILKKQGLTVFSSVHDLNVASCYCDKIILMKSGKIVAIGTPEEMFTPDMIRRLFGVSTEVTVNSATGKPNIVFIPSEET